MDFGFLLSAIIFLVCLALRCGYELLKEANRIDPENKPTFAVILTVMCLLWVSWFRLCPLDPFPVDLPDSVRWFGIGIFGAGMVLAVGALIQLRGVENIKHLVTTGLFRKIRHPMYAGFVFWILGWSIYHGAPVSLGIGLIGVGSVLWWRRLEEARLKMQFGSAYEQYRLASWF
jgi:protein-S-isoprenylcysteine O-methyltransferase Ste14